jgi:RNA polymerase sigma-B factor
MSLVMDRNVDALLIAYHRGGDEAAREQALIELMPLVRALASRYAGRGEPLEDLVQVGSVGLIKAVDRFDVDRGVEFSSYAVPTIVGEIRRHFRDKAWAMHVPRRLKELSVRLSRVLDQLTTELGRSPTVPELARAAGVEEEDVIDALDSAQAYSTRSLHAPFDDDGDESLADRLGVEERGYDEVEDGTLVSAGLGALDERERRIVELRFFHEMTQSQIAAELGISQMHVSRLLRRALELMRGRIEELTEDPR